jgi:hypothetical protein
MAAGAKEELQLLKFSERVHVERQTYMRAVMYFPHLPAKAPGDMGHPAWLLVW